MIQKQPFIFNVSGINVTIKDIEWLNGLINKTHVKINKKQRYHFAYKGPYSQSYDFSSSHVWIWELHHTEGWTVKNWCFHTVMLEKILKSPWDSKVAKPDNPKGNQPWIFIGRTDAEAEAPILWPPDAKSWRIGNDPDAGKDWRQEIDQGWHNSWMASLIQWTWVWANSRRQCRTGKTGVLQSMGSQRVVFDWATEQQQQSKLRWVFTYRKYPKVQLGIFKLFHITVKVYLYLVSISFTCQKNIL